MKHKQYLIFAAAMILMLVLVGCGQADNQDDLSSPQADDNAIPAAANQSTSQSSAEAETDTTDFWVEINDPELGFRFAVPCFWRMEANVTESSAAESGTGYSYGFFNYPADYPDLFDEGIIPVDNNPFEVVFSVIELAGPMNASLLDYENEAYNELLSSGEITEFLVEGTTLNQSEAVQIYVNEDLRSYKYFVVRIDAEHLLEIKAYPSSKLFDTLDLQAVLASLTFDVEAGVPLPGHVPGVFPSSPAEGAGASCINGPLGSTTTTNQ